jgi:para-nitrobenzyl esterase
MHMRFVRFALIAAAGFLGVGCSSSSATPGAQPSNDAATSTPEGGAGSPLVTIASGMVQGHPDGSVAAFLGIPYAKPPTGALRWAPPQKPDPWTTVLDAATFGKRCAQNANTTLQTTGSTDEDCLYLNVWTPNTAASKLPVMVWIHGGGNTGGSASDPLPFGDAGQFLYDGAHIAANGVVVVSLNYRLGIFGFFAHPGLAGEGSHAGNQGLWDQRFAMQWVQDNIAKFGGDPTNVTIFGESAGSLDVCMHVASPQTPPLFARAISESGGCTTRQPTLAENQPLVLAVAAAVGCLGNAGPEGGAPEAGAPSEAGAANDAGDDGATGAEAGTITDAGVAAADAGDVTASLACLRNLPAATLLATAAAQSTGPTAGSAIVPVVDGDFFADQPRTLYQGGKIAKVPYILGSNNDEGNLFEYGATAVTDQTGLNAAIAAQFGDAGAAIEQEYPVSAFDGGMPNPYQAALTQVVGDSLLICSTYDSAILASNQGLPVWTYNFDQPLEFPHLVGPGPGEVDLGATHGAELPYVFGTSPIFATNAGEATVSALMERYWTRFAAGGDPNGGSDLSWPKFSAASNQRMQFNLQPSVLTDFHAPQCNFWIGLYEAQFVSP